MGLSDQNRRKDRPGNIWNCLLWKLGFCRNPEAVEEQLKEADILANMFLSSAVAGIEIWMLVRYVYKYVRTGICKTVGSFFEYTCGYWILLLASVFVIVYGILYFKGKLSFSRRFSRVITFAYFSLGIYFGTVTSLADLHKGRMLTCFLAMIMYATMICIWRPFFSIGLIVACSSAFIYFVNHNVIDAGGNPYMLDEGDLVNYITYMISLIVLALSVYYQRHGDATKSYQLHLASITDDLTGIPNMRRFEELAREYIGKRGIDAEKPVYLVLNFSNFQTYNDRFGYEGGDNLLRSMAAFIGEQFPDEPYARISADYFAVLTYRRDYRTCVDRIRASVYQSFGEETYLKVKVGSYLEKDVMANARHAVDRATYALKISNNIGENEILEYDDETSRKYHLRQYILNHLEEAIEKGWIQVYYQPVVWAENGGLCGCEALARWIDPEMGFLSPGVFIPILEESRQIYKLDLCVYETVCKNMRRCMDEGLPVLPTSLNFSRLDFELMDAVGELEKLVNRYGIPREYLHVEITESALTEDEEGLKQAMQRLHEDGYVIWLDDFGSGYSSMNVLKDYNFDLLKIDMVFLKNFSGNENARRIIRSILNLARELNMLTLTEGVETQEAVEFLQKEGCERLQGYFYGKPMVYDEILAKLADGTLWLDLGIEEGCR